MFRKLISNLPYSPSLINQVGFYANRLKAEKSIRRISFVFMALAMSVQSLAVISPPERSLAASNNHVINGGAYTRQSILNAWNSDSTVPKIFAKFGITLDDIRALPERPNTVIDTGSGTDWWSVGRNSLTGYTNVDDVFKSNQIALEYDDGEYVYYRQLRAWDIRNPSNRYDAYKGTRADGSNFWIIANCGNIATIGTYEEPEKPRLDIRKTINAQSTTLKPGDSFKFRIEYRNSMPESTAAQDVFIRDELDTTKFDVVSPASLPVNANGYLNYPVPNLEYSPNYKVLDITVRLKNPLATPTEVCNRAEIVASNAPKDISERVCINVYNPCPFDTDIQDANNPNCVEPKVVCSVVDAALNRTKRSVSYKTTVESTNDKLVNVLSYSYDFGDSTKREFSSNEFMHTTTHTYEPGDYTTTVIVRYTAPTASGTTEQTTDCQHSVSFDADEPLGQLKSVRNITQDLEGEDALGSVVQAGDVLEYSLATINTQDYDRENILIEDYIGDILDYAELNIADVESTDGTYDNVKQKVRWENVTIPANSQVEMTFQVTLLDPIPSTNSPSNVSTDFDCKISNQYGNEITLNVQCPVVKGLETLPNTGPGESIALLSVFTATVGYFFARSSLLSKEVALVRTDYATNGGA